MEDLEGNLNPLDMPKCGLKNDFDEVKMKISFMMLESYIMQWEEDWKIGYYMLLIWMVAELK